MLKSLSILFKELSDCSKNWKTKNLREQVQIDLLMYAPSVSHRASGNNNAAKLIKYITTTPTIATKIHKVIFFLKQSKIEIIK